MAIQHVIRTPDGGTREVTMTRGKAIRFHCLDCCGWDQIEVRLCTAYTCPLWPYRMGTAGVQKLPVADIIEA